VISSSHAVAKGARPPAGALCVSYVHSPMRYVWEGEDEYSSHVGPIFFRLHKWIDDRIEDWAEAHGTEVVRAPPQHGFQWFRPGRWVEVANPWNGAFGFDHVPPEEERRRLEAMQNATKVLFPPPKTLLRFKGAAAEREEEQRRIISLRDMIM